MTPALLSAPEALLEAAGTVLVSATSSKFVAKENFVPTMSSDGRTIIKHVAINFKTWFLNGEGKIEDPISEQRLVYYKLRRRAMDASIITELGGEAKAETTLSEVFSLMMMQKHGEAGVLLNRHRKNNIFFVRDNAGVLRVICVALDRGWNVGAAPIDNPYGWDIDCQLLSRTDLV